MWWWKDTFLVLKPDTWRSEDNKNNKIKTSNCQVEGAQDMAVETQRKGQLGLQIVSDDIYYSHKLLNFSLGRKEEEGNLSKDRWVWCDTLLGMVHVWNNNSYNLPGKSIGIWRNREKIWNSDTIIQWWHCIREPEWSASCCFIEQMP